MLQLLPHEIFTASPIALSYGRPFHYAVVTITYDKIFLH